MLKAVVDGFYKSMTTMVYKSLWDGGEFVLYEPLAPNMVRNVEQMGAYSPTHGVDIRSCYFDERFAGHFDTYKRIHERYQESIGGDLTPSQLEQVEGFFEFVDGLPNQTIVQPNNCHFILDELRQKYDCKIVFLLRNPVETWISFVLEPPFDMKGVKKEWGKSGASLAGMRKRLFDFRDKNEWLAKKLLLNCIPLYLKGKYSYRGKEITPYFIEPRYRLMQRYFPELKLPDTKDPVTTFLANYVLANYHGYKNAKKAGGLILSYEWMVESPERAYDRLTSLGLSVDKTVFNKLSPDFRTILPSVQEEIEQRIGELGLMEMYKSFKRW